MTKSKGFTLIELMIVVAVIGILLSIAYPSFMEQVRQSRRSDGYAALMQAAAMEERYFTVNNSYSSTLSDIGGASSPEGYYTVSVVVSGGGYTLSAAGSGSQASDTDCTPLVLSHTGVKTPAGCW
ncbi:type IV pilin protein [Amphritea sp. 1_MG-2023]|uniref:type IV pilin protein n=1 Tax=Amphritea sp. 1_MG-2023 TaxID=3062670 RepID=UPI0026E2D7ED|nr:type IV pilin protein [Amphritea sp. 1_MG-2023]MDO6563627.1 type IV pilin protein [Amphritea sp. 1_MG-2023]